MSNCNRNKNNNDKEDKTNNPIFNDQFNEVIKNSFNLQESSFGMSKSKCQKKYLELLIEQIKQNSSQIEKLKSFSNLSIFNTQLDNKQRAATESRKRKKENNSLANNNTDNIITNTTTEDISKLINNLEVEYQSHMRKMKIDIDAKINERKIELNKERDEALNEKYYVIFALENEQDNIQKDINQKKKSMIPVDQSKSIQDNLENNYQEIINMKRFIINDYYTIFIEKKKNETALAKTNSELLKKKNNNTNTNNSNDNTVKNINSKKAAQSKSNKNVSDKNIIAPQSQKNIKARKDVYASFNQSKKLKEK